MKPFMTKHDVPNPGMRRNSDRDGFKMCEQTDLDNPKLTRHGDAHRNFRNMQFNMAKMFKEDLRETESTINRGQELDDSLKEIKHSKK